MNTQLAATLNRLDDATNTAEVLVRLKQQLSDGELFHEIFKRIVRDEETAIRVANALMDGGFVLEDARAEEHAAAEEAADFIYLLVVADWNLRFPWKERR